jgi:hypothetical protein
MPPVSYGLERYDQPMFDFKKERGDLYGSNSSPRVVDVPEMTFIAVDGVGDPNTGEDYSSAVQVIYGLSYAVKMGNKSVLEYVVAPLEGFWSVTDEDFRGGGSPIADKSAFVWTALIRQPDFVTQDVFASTCDVVARKKPKLDLARARLVHFAEGLCAQATHLGPYDDEPATVAAIDAFAVEHGYAIDLGGGRRHHEIYLSDPRKVAPEKMRTILRHPIRGESI